MSAVKGVIKKVIGEEDHSGLEEIEQGALV